MFDEKTVIIIGAGASAEFNIPTGKQIFDHIAIPENPTTQRHIEQQSGKEYSVFGNNFSEYFQDQFDSGNLNNDILKIEKLGRESYHSSIDLLAIRNPSLLRVAKLLSAWCILSKMYKVEERELSSNHNPGPTSTIIEPTNAWREPIIDGARNWISVLVEEYLTAGNTATALEKNQLSVVSFNYDSIFENGLWNFLTQDEIFNDLPFSAMPKVMHVFGNFPQLNNKINRQEIESYSKHISFMGETVKNKYPHIQEIKSKINSAKKIFLVGFDCHGKNVELIGLNETSADIYAINYDGNEAFNSRLRNDLGVPDNHIMIGSETSKMGASKAFSNGFLDLRNRFTKRNIYEDRGIRTV